MFGFLELGFLLFGPIEEPCGDRLVRVDGWNERGAWLRVVSARSASRP
jgi:hypothetical protein